MTRKNLMLFSADFPFGTGETFLETEIHFLAKEFQKITIVSTNCSSEQTRMLPENCDVVRLNLSVSKVQSVRGIINTSVSKEISVIRNSYRKQLSPGILKTLLVSYARAKKVVQFVEENSQFIENTVFYSYWCDDIAIGLALIQKRYPQAKTATRVHGWDLFFDRSSINYLPFRHLIARHISHIFSISELGLRYVKEIWKVDMGGKISLAKLGVKNDFPLKKIQRDYFLIVSCSSLISLKRVTLIAEAIRTISAIKIHWIHIGDGPERKQVEKVCADFQDNVTYDLKGNIPNHSIYQIYDELRPDLFINVSTTEGIPVSIMEAMSFGIPVIATKVGGTSEIVNQNNGTLVDSDITSEELREQIGLFLNGESKRENAYQTWQTYYNADVNYECFAQRLKEL